MHQLSPSHNNTDLETTNKVHQLSIELLSGQLSESEKEDSLVRSHNASGPSDDHSTRDDEAGPDNGNIDGIKATEYVTAGNEGLQSRESNEKETVQCSSLCPSTTSPPEINTNSCVSGNEDSSTSGTDTFQTSDTRKQPDSLYCGPKSSTVSLNKSLPSPDKFPILTTTDQIVNTVPENESTSREKESEGKVFSNSSIFAGGQNTTNTNNESSNSSTCTFPVKTSSSLQLVPSVSTETDLFTPKPGCSRPSLNSSMTQSLFQNQCDTNQEFNLPTDLLNSETATRQSTRSSPAEQQKQIFESFPREEEKLKVSLSKNQSLSSSNGILDSGENFFYPIFIPRNTLLEFSIQ